MGEYVDCDNQTIDHSKVLLCFDGEEWKTRSAWLGALVGNKNSMACVSDFVITALRQKTLKVKSLLGPRRDTCVQYRLNGTDMTRNKA